MAVVAGASSEVFVSRELLHNPNNLSTGLALFSSHIFFIKSAPNGDLASVIQFDRRSEAELGEQIEGIRRHEEFKGTFQKIIYSSPFFLGDPDSKHSDWESRELVSGVKFSNKKLNDLESIQGYGSETDLIQADFEYLKWLLDQSPGPGVFAVYQPKVIKLFVIGEDGLLLANQFTIQSVADAVYYLNLTFRQLKLDPMSFPVYLGGNFSANSEFVNLSKKYLAKVSMLNGVERFDRWPFSNPMIPAHYYPELASSLS